MDVEQADKILWVVAVIIWSAILGALAGIASSLLEYIFTGNYRLSWWSIGGGTAVVAYFLFRAYRNRGRRMSPPR